MNRQPEIKALPAIYCSPTAPSCGQMWYKYFFSSCSTLGAILTLAPYKQQPHPGYWNLLWLLRLRELIKLIQEVRVVNVIQHDDTTVADTQWCQCVTLGVLLLSSCFIWILIKQDGDSPGPISSSPASAGGKEDREVGRKKGSRCKREKGESEEER